MPTAHNAPVGRDIRSVAVPKPGGGFRRLTVLGPAEATAYARVVQRVTPAIERHLGPEAVANRAPGGRALEPWQSARVRWRRAAAGLARLGSVTTMDVETCYDAISPEVVGTALEGMAVSSPAGEDVTAFLRVLRDGGVPGLPIGPDPSAILANAVLASVDAALRAEGISFIRWVDDFVIAGTPRRLGGAELRVEAALRTLGLKPNLAKHRRAADRDEARSMVLGREAMGPSGIEILGEP